MELESIHFSLCSWGKFCLERGESVTTTSPGLGFNCWLSISVKRCEKMRSTLLSCSLSWDHTCQPLKGDVTPHITIPCASQYGDGCYVQAGAGLLFISLCGHVGAREGSGQCSLRPGQAPSANCTLPGASPAPPELCHQRSWCWERAEEGLPEM